MAMCVFSTAGEPLGFVVESFIFDSEGVPLGWILGSHVHRLDGSYVGEWHQQMVVERRPGPPGPPHSVRPLTAPARRPAPAQFYRRAPVEDYRQYQDAFSRLHDPVPTDLESV